MKSFKGKVAVVTGAASGIGRALAVYCAQKEMKIVLADIEQSALIQTESDLISEGADVIAVLTDVSKSNQVETLAQKTLESFGSIHLLFNNAGVAAGSTIWESTLADWKWVVDVNMWGIIHGLHVFVPIMLDQNTECHIVNTASVVGLLNNFTSSSYQVTKHAVVAISEQLYHSLAEINAKVKTSVLCPGWVRTHILNSKRNHPDQIQDKSSHKRQTDNHFAQEDLESGVSPEIVAEHVFHAIRENKFYVFVNADEYKSLIRMRMENILEESNPSLT